MPVATDKSTYPTTQNESNHSDKELLEPTDRAQVLYLYNGQFVSSNSCFRNCENVKRLSFKVFLRQDSISQRQSVALGVSMGRIMKFTLRAEAHWPPTRKSF
jgi:hypothetical protein